MTRLTDHLEGLGQDPAEWGLGTPEEVSATVAPLSAEGSPVAPGDVNIGLKNNQIMQRYLVRRIFREVEFRVTETDGHETVGFITGFDDKVLQMSTSPETEIDEPHSVLIFWPIRRISETGRLIDNLQHEHKSKIRSYSHALKAQCELHLNGSKNGTQQHAGRKGGTPSFSDRV